MINFSRRINNDYAWDFDAFAKNRDFSDGVEFFTFIVNWDRYLMDHTPQFQFSLVILNWTIFDFTIYYIHHRDALGNSIEPNSMNECCHLSHAKVEKRLDKALKDQ